MVFQAFVSKRAIWILHATFALDDLDKECKAGNLGFQEHGSMNKLHCLSWEAKDIFGKSNVALYLHGCRFLLRKGPSWPRTDLSFSLARASGFCSASFRHLPSQLWTFTRPWPGLDKAWALALNHKFTDPETHFFCWPMFALGFLLEDSLTEGILGVP